jgi:hypothetical protein
LLVQRIAKAYLPLALAEPTHLQWNCVPNQVSYSLGHAWRTIEKLIALLSKNEDYRKGIDEMQSWLNPTVCRIFVPYKKDHKLFERAVCLVDECRGPPEWEESMEYIEMLQAALFDLKHCPLSERNFRLSRNESSYFIVCARPHADQNGIAGCAWNELQLLCGDQTRRDEPLTGFLPQRRLYTCHVCREPGDGYCWASTNVDKTQLFYCVHPKCVFENSMAGPLKSLRGESERLHISPALYERCRTAYDSNKTDYNSKVAWERNQFVIDSINSHDAELFLGTSPQTFFQEQLQLSKLKKSMLRSGVIDEIVQILRVSLPQKFDHFQATEYNAKMQRRMQIQRINFRFEAVSATDDVISITENIFQRMFHFLALAAKDCREIQNALHSEVPFILGKTLHTNSSASSGIFDCIRNVMNGRLDLISNFSVDLLEQTLISALETQFPAQLLLLRLFLAQDGKNFPLNQTEVLDICMPANVSSSGECCFTIDNDFPADLSDKAAFEKWKTRLFGSQPPSNSSFGLDVLHSGPFPWHKRENWRHMLRVSSDIAHGGYVAGNQSCASAFHLAIIVVLTDCVFNNTDTVSFFFVSLFCLYIFIVTNIHFCFQFTSAETKIGRSTSIHPRSSNFEQRLQRFTPQNMGLLFPTARFKAESIRPSLHETHECHKRSTIDLLKF